MADNLNCRLCGFPGSDVRFEECGCTLHARCFPLSVIARKQQSVAGDPLQAINPGSVLCPCCMSAPVHEVVLFPMPLKDLERAVELRKAESRKKKPGVLSDNDSHRSDSDFLEAQAESSYLLMSHSQSTGLAADADYQRTGRWTDEEIAYVDLLLDAFDRGQLPIPEGTRLNDFLCEILLCKASRLTKKMKHAKLSSRCYTVHGEAMGMVGVNRQLLSSLEEQFIKSITSAPARLELRFNVTKAWRTLFSNMCLQIGTSMLSANEWIASLEDMESRAMEAEENLRTARRRRMGMALKTDSRSGQNGVYFSGIAVNRSEIKRQRTSAEGQFTVPQVVDTSSATSVATTDDGSEADFISNMLDLGGNDPLRHKRRDSFDDFSMIFDEMSRTATDFGAQHVRNNTGSFLEAIVGVIEAKNLPFQHVDVWVPSYGSGGEEKLRLYHAGHATRHDIESGLYLLLTEYGEYSTRFSFAPSVGLPGRVFETGQPKWERHIDDADPKHFERAGGAKVYGVKTGFGLAMSTSVIGRMVVAMYSTADVEEDFLVIQTCQDELAKFSPEPKWKLVVDMTSKPDASAVTAPPVLPVGNSADLIVQPGGLVHYKSGATVHRTSVTPIVPKSTVSLSGSTPVADARHEEEQRIANLLGEHLPLAEIPMPGKSSTASTPVELIPLFMSLRLMLLRSPARRSEEENEIVAIICKSYKGYIQDQRRSEKDIAILLVQDWQFLQSTLDSTKPTAKGSVGNPSHVMGAPAAKTYSASGAPAPLPRMLPLMGQPSSLRHPSFDDSLVRHRQHGSLQVFPADDVDPLLLINIVDGP